MLIMLIIKIISVFNKLGLVFRFTQHRVLGAVFKISVLHRKSDIRASYGRDIWSDEEAAKADLGLSAYLYEPG